MAPDRARTRASRQTYRAAAGSTAPTKTTTSQTSKSKCRPIRSRRLFVPAAASCGPRAPPLAGRMARRRRTGDLAGEETTGLTTCRGLRARRAHPAPGPSRARGPARTIVVEEVHRVRRNPDRDGPPPRPYPPQVSPRPRINGNNEYVSYSRRSRDLSALRRPAPPRSRGRPR